MSRSRLPFTAPQMSKLIKQAQAAAELNGLIVTGFNASTGEVVHRPMTDTEREDAAPFVKVEEAAKIARCSSVEQFKLLIKEGIFPRGVGSQKWDKRILRSALTCAQIKNDNVGHSEIYFLEVGNFIKIGYSTGVFSRIAQMQTGSPYEIKLIGTILGSVRNEEEIHSRFAHLRHRGEWFKKTRGLLAYIDWLREQS